MDCPYYEQLQYVDDTRIQALVTLYNTSDDRLVRNAISQVNDSRTAEGATMSRAPIRQQQYIPPFSFWWIGIVHDYWWYRDDPTLVKQMLPGVRAMLSFFNEHQQPKGSLGKLPWWNYVDWTPQWQGGVPPRRVSNGWRFVRTSDNQKRGCPVSVARSRIRKVKWPSAWS
jgi:alpha-L-rhamnosidase